MKYECRNEKTGKSFTVEDGCIFVIRDKIREGIKKRGWYEADCFSRRVR